MAPRYSIRAHTTASLSDDLRIPSNTPSLLKPLNRLSRSSLIDVALQWLDEKTIDLYPPHLARRGGIGEREGGEWEGNEDDDETNPYPAARDAEEVRSVYEELRDRKGGKREVIDRILEGDWRQGLSLRQLATIDIRFIEDHPAGQQRWTALQLTRISSRESTDREDPSASLPRFHASTFLRNLQREISPLVKAHYHISRLKSLPLTLLRIFVTDSPYRQPRQASHTFLDASRIIYVAFPDSCPFIYTSLSSPAPTSTSSSTPTNNLATNAKTLRMIVRDSIPKAFSRPQERYSLQSTSLTAKSLQTLLSLRGPGRTNSANGIFSIFADAVVDTSPIDPRFNSLPPASVETKDKSDGASVTRQTPEASANISHKRPLADSSNYLSQKSKIKDPQASKKRKLQAAAVSSRFGTTTSKTTAPLDRLQIHLQDPPRLDGEDPEPASYEDDVNTNTEPTTSRTLSLTFSGTDVISGIRQLAECGIVDPERMPSWMTGEEGVSSAAIRGGRRKGRGG